MLSLLGYKDRREGRLLEKTSIFDATAVARFSSTTVCSAWATASWITATWAALVTSTFQFATANAHLRLQKPMATRCARQPERAFNLALRHARSTCRTGAHRE